MFFQYLTGASFLTLGLYLCALLYLLFSFGCCESNVVLSISVPLIAWKELFISEGTYLCRMR